MLPRSGLLLASLALAACAATIPAGPTVLALPGQGKTFEVFQAEDLQCRDYAAGRVSGLAEAASQSASGNAVLGTALGAAIGALFGAGGGNAGAGAAIGGATGLLVGSSSGANAAAYAGVNAQAQYDASYLQCMLAKGNSAPTPARLRGYYAYRPYAYPVYPPGYYYYGPPY
jgi:Glycine-zipper domain